MNCSKCGAPTPGHASFCMACGAALDHAPGAAVTSHPPIQQTTPAIAIVGFVLSLIPFCFISVVGLVLGVIALDKIKNRPREFRGRGLALAAVIIASVWLAIGGVGMAAAIAIPNFIKFQARSKQAEARANLKTLYSAVEAAQGASDTPPAGFSEVRWTPASKRRYAYFLSADVLQPNLGGPYALPDDVPEDAVAVAVSNIDSDETLDVWVVGADGHVENVVSDLTQ